MADTTTIELTQLCSDAHADSVVKATGCSGLVRYFARNLNIELPQIDANGLIKHMQDNWTELTEADAQKTADAGTFVVAGKANPGGSGHVVVVMPGGMVPAGGYKDRKGNDLPKKGLYARACSTTISSNPWPGTISTGDKSVFDSWYSNLGVKFWTPKS
jgi:cell wall-associated NlpC family hydrolase